MYGIPRLTLLDLATGVRQDIGAGLRKGAGMLDLTWIDDTKLLSCGYDSYARLWDMRSGTCVRKWEEPFNEAIYCMSTDNNMTLVRFFKVSKYCLFQDQFEHQILQKDQIILADF